MRKMNWKKLKFLVFFQNFAFTFLCKSQPQICSSQKPKIPSPVVEKINNNEILDAAGLQTKPQSALRTLTAIETTSKSHQSINTESGDQTSQLPSSTISVSLDTTTKTSLYTPWPETTSWPVTTSIPFTTLDFAVPSTSRSCRPKPTVVQRGQWLVFNLPPRPLTNETEKCSDKPSGENGTATEPGTTTEPSTTTEPVSTTEPRENTNLTTTEVETTTRKIEESEGQILAGEKEINLEFNQKPSSNSTSGEKQVETVVTTTNGFCGKFLQNYISFVLTLILSMP